MAGTAEQKSALRQRRLERGHSEACASSHHDRCVTPACACRCHSDPEGFHRRQEHHSAAARRAHETRRRNAGQSAETAETPPNRPKVESGQKAALPAAAAKQVKSEFSLLLWVGDQGAARLVPKYWTTPEDRLTDDERVALVNASYAYLESTELGRRILKMLNKVSESAPLAQLLYTVAMIAAPRLAHHQVIPAELASAIVFAPLLFAQQSAAATDGADTGAAASVESVGAPQSDRPDWYGQVDASGVPFTVPPVQSGPPVETGHGPLRHPTDHQNGAGH